MSRELTKLQEVETTMAWADTRTRVRPAAAEMLRDLFKNGERPIREHPPAPKSRLRIRRKG